MDSNIIRTDEENRNFLMQKQESHSVAAAVATEALGHEDIEAFFSGVLQFGCVSGTV